MRRGSLLTLFILTVLLPVCLYAQQHRFTVGMDPQNIPFTYIDKSGDAQGFYVDLWRLWAQKNGYEVAFVPASLPEAIESVRHKRTDFYAALYHPLQGVLLGNAIHKEKVALFIHHETEITTPNALKGKRIGVVETRFGDELKQKYPTVQIVSVPTYAELIRRGAAGEFDALFGVKAAIMSRLIASQQSHRFDTTVFDTEVNAAVHPASSDKKLIDLFNRGWKKLSKRELIELEKRWIYNDTDRTYRTGADLLLTPEEQHWINTHRVRVGGETDWPPFDFVKNGRYQGIAKEMLDLIVQKSGMKVEYVIGKSWTELLDDFKKGNIDLLPAIYKTEERTRFTRFSPPYFTIKDYAFTRSDDESLKKVSDLAEKSVAVIDGYAVIDNLKQLFPQIDLLPVKNLPEGVDAVLLGKADVYIEAYPTMMHTLSETMQSGIKPVLPLDFYSNKLYMGVGKSEPLLASIITKGMNAITPEEKNAILTRWMAVDVRSVSLELTAEEQAWIVAHPVIKVGSGDNWPPFNYIDSNGDFKGITKDYLDLISEVSGLQIDLRVAPWKETYRTFVEGELDMLPAALYTKEREKYGRFEEAHLKLRDFIYARADDDRINSFEDLNGKRLARIKKYATLDPYLPLLKDVKVIEVENMLEMVNAVYNNEADAFLESQPTINHILKENMIGGLKSIAQSVVSPTTVHMLVKKDEKILYTIIKKSLNHITAEQRDAIYARWVNLNGQGLRTLNLTQGERAWLLQNKEIRIVSDPAWPPFDFYDAQSDTYKGIGQNYFQKISELTGIEFVHVKVQSRDNAIEKIKKREADMFTCTKRTAQRDRFLNFTDTFVSYPIVIVTRNSEEFVPDIMALAGKKVVLVGNFAITEQIKKDYPDLKIVEVMSASEALQYVASGRAYAFLGSLGTVTYTIRDEGFVNLKIAGRTEYEFSWGAAVRNDWPQEALSVMNKALDAISDEERNEIYNRWVSVQFDERIDYTLLWKIVGGMLVLLGIFGFYHYKTQQQKQFVQTLLNSQEQIIVTTKGETILQVNRAFLEFFRVASVKEFRAKYDAECICDVFNTEAPVGYLQKMMGGMAWVDYVINRPMDVTPKAMITREDEEHIFSVSAALLPGKTGQKVAVFTDISEIETQQQALEALNRKVSDSIEYASLIQGALVPASNVIREHFDDYFALWHPKDVVGGDIYLFEQLRHENESLLMVIDCTGHGVPGAFVTMLVKALEQQYVTMIQHSDEEVSPAEILAFFNRSIKHLLGQEENESISNAGFDGGILYYDRARNLIRFAGAEIPLFIAKGGEIRVIKGDRHSIGYKNSNADFSFTDHEITIDEETLFYLSTDGYLDQNGGEKGFPLGKKRFKGIIESYAAESMADQQELFLFALLNYQGRYERNDDVTLVAVRLHPYDSSCEIADDMGTGNEKS